MWREAVVRSDLLQNLGLEQEAQLRAKATWFLHSKRFYSHHGAELRDADRCLIAAIACLPVLYREHSWLDGWYSIHVYPGRFRSRRPHYDELGLISEHDRVLSGEAHGQGGMILSWQDVVDDCSGKEDGNVILHEIAHKLDFRNGVANGLPPLPREISTRRWTDTFQAAFDSLSEDLQRGATAPIDPYAAEAPAEFFAVATETFFTAPRLLRAAYPAVFELLANFFDWRGAKALRLW